MYREIERRIYVTDEILLNEWYYLYGVNRDKKVVFHYYNVKYDRMVAINPRSYAECLSLARSRRSDGRYKNFEFYISEC